MIGRPSILVFGKIPAAGKVKTRLIARVSPDDAADLYEAFLGDTLDKLCALGFDVRLYLAPSDDPLQPGFVPTDVQVFRQKGDDLGRRMLNALVESFAAGYERLVLVGSDHPTLPPDFVALAFDALQQPCSVAIGPASDGGYYLVGMNELYPTLFQGIEYSRPDVFVRTLERIEATDANLTILPDWYDVDTPESLSRLVRQLVTDEAAAPRTAAVVRELRSRGVL